MRLRLLLLFAACLMASAGGLSAAALEIGKPAREWQVGDWLNSEPLTLADLRGKVVLVRWWTAPGCPYCAATASALNELHQQYASRGLTVIALYHHKSDAPLSTKDVAAHANRFGFKFPVAIDHDWQTLRQWWLDGQGQKWTSVSFLIDQQGRVHHIHEGGEYPLGSSDYALMRKKIEELLR